MGKTGILLLTALLWSIISAAQYVNTDSLVVVPGFAAPLTLAELDSLQIFSPGLLPGIHMPFLYGNNNITGEILSGFILPSEGNVISRFGMRSGRMHTGTDVKMDKGDTIYAVFDGAVTRARYYHGYGNMVVISHGNNLETCYAHLSAFLVKDDELVQKGEPVGLAGATGRATTSHLHFEIRENNKPYNPELVFNFEDGTVREKATSVENLADLNPKQKVKSTAGNDTTPEIYKVQPGDSLWKISRRFRTSLNSLCQLNNLTETSVLQVGQVLQVYLQN